MGGKVMPTSFRSFVSGTLSTTATTSLSVLSPTMAAPTTILRNAAFRPTTSVSPVMLARSFQSSAQACSSSSRGPTSLRSLASRFSQQSQTFKHQSRSVYQTFNGAGSSSSQSSQAFWTRMLGTAGVTAAGFIGVNAFLNRETRDALPHFERKFLNDTFKYVGGGLAIIAGSAVLLHKNGVSLRMMSMNPWAFAGISLVGGIGSMSVLFACNPESTTTKRASSPPHTNFVVRDADWSITQTSLGLLSTASKRSLFRH